MSVKKHVPHREDWIVVKGAREHNLKNIDVSIPRNALTVISGLSGSGKSSLAFNTIFAEGQRRYLESLSAYARQFLQQTRKPDVDEIHGLSPAISIDQKTRSSSPRSTVATVTEIYDYLRVLYARVGTAHCPICSKPIHAHSKDDIVAIIHKDIANAGWHKKKKKIAGVPYNDQSVDIYAPVVIERKGEYFQLLYELLRKGYESVRVDGVVYPLHNRIEMSRTKKHTIEAVVDNLYLAQKSNDPQIFKKRLNEAVDRALKEAGGVVRIVYPDKEERLIASKFFCPHDGGSLPEMEPRLFSFNSPQGACQSCNGLGTVEGELGDETCPTCNGKRLRLEPRSIYIGAKKQRKNIAEVVELSVEEAYEFFNECEFKGQNVIIAEPLLKEIIARLHFLIDVGLEYVTLNRRSNTLSGGEAQRIRLASQVGSGLLGTLYVLDEPTIGLHQRDNDRLIRTLLKLRDTGNTVIVVEHDEDMLRTADYLVDVGPEAGEKGGTILVADWIENLLKAKNTTKYKSRTLAYLRNEDCIPTSTERRKGRKDSLSIRGATKHNISNLNVDIPLGKYVAITGVSGSGKSTLLYHIVHPNLAFASGRRVVKCINAKKIDNAEKIQRTILVDQAPLGRTPRSTPITYVGAAPYVRNLFALTEEARLRGWQSGRFSFNTPDGRCPHCEGNGSIAVEMHFLPSVYVICDGCNGTRFQQDVLEVQFRGKNIHEVLQMSVMEARDFFSDIPPLLDRFQALVDTGMGYIRLGQPSTTLSGGEAQRVKISSELYRPNTTHSLYLLDEPTVGLHYDDVRRLITIFNRIVDKGNTLVVIEHNLDVIKNADHIIDMGPDGGDKGGTIVVSGTPEEVAKKKESHTGTYLKKIL